MFGSIDAAQVSDDMFVAFSLNMLSMLASFMLLLIALLAPTTRPRPAQPIVTQRERYYLLSGALALPVLSAGNLVEKFGFSDVWDAIGVFRAAGDTGWLRVAAMGWSVAVLMVVPALMVYAYCRPAYVLRRKAGYFELSAHRSMRTRPRYESSEIRRFA